VRNVTTGVEEDLDFRDYVIKISIQFNHLIVITTSQCFIYKTSNWTAPHHFDLKETNVTLVLQSDKHFLLIDIANVGLYSYEGRLLLNVKWVGMRIEALNKESLRYCIH
jgi:intraflagellar transport protein 80